MLEVWDQGAGMVRFRWGPSSWLADGCFLAVSSHGLSPVPVTGESASSLGSPLIRVLIRPDQGSMFIVSHWRVGCQHMGFGRAHTSSPQCCSSHSRSVWGARSLGSCITGPSWRRTGKDLPWLAEALESPATLLPGVNEQYRSQGLEMKLMRKDQRNTDCIADRRWRRLLIFNTGRDTTQNSDQQVSTATGGQPGENRHKLQYW